VTSVVLVDDHPVVRDGLAAILSAEPDLSVVGQAGNGEEALKLVARVEPDVVVLDVRLPGMSGIEACAALIARHPQLRVVVLTSYPNEGVLLDALTAGATGFVVKTTDRAVLREAIRTVAGGQTFVDPQVAGKVVHLAAKGSRAKGPHGLTLQEMRVLELVPRGLTNVEIGRELGVSAETVKSHLASAMRKLQVRDRTAAAAVAMREGLA